MADEGSGEYMVVNATLEGFGLPLDMARFAMASTTAALIAGTATDDSPKPSATVLLYALDALLDDSDEPGGGV
ncbi:hypothetical protein ASE16_08085 [Leifsonia sp. Root227]|nr:hypothetical protein ASE16_08085 [Leifsonia sp. Root227]